MNEHGWRMPNQAELSVIYLVGTDASAYGSYKKNEFNGLKGQTVFARTSYSGIAKMENPDNMLIGCLLTNIFL